MSRSIEDQGSSPLIQPVVEPFQRFIHTESAAGILLIVSTVVALMWANSPWSEAYTAFRRLPVTLGVGEFVLTEPLVLWISDGLMAMFFSSSAWRSSVRCWSESYPLCAKLCYLSPPHWVDRSCQRCSIRCSMREQRVRRVGVFRWLRISPFRWGSSRCSARGCRSRSRHSAPAFGASPSSVGHSRRPTAVRIG